VSKNALWRPPLSVRLPEPWPMLSFRYDTSFQKGHQTKRSNRDQGEAHTDSPSDLPSG
jgi:hypothetical protein